MRCNLPVAPLGISARNRIFRGVLYAARRSDEERAKLLLGRAHTLAQDDRRADVLAEHRVRHGERDRLQHGWMVHQRFVDLAGRNFLAAAIDDLLEPSGEREIAVGVDDALIAGAEPAVDERFAVRLRIVLIAGGDAFAANDDLSGLALRRAAAPLRP